jgi:hypothetical protein
MYTKYISTCTLLLNVCIVVFMNTPILGRGEWGVGSGEWEVGKCIVGFFQEYVYCSTPYCPMTVQVCTVHYTRSLQRPL